MELGAARRHYHAPLTRTPTWGKRRTESRSSPPSSSKAENRALEVARPGITCAEVELCGRECSIERLPQGKSGRLLHRPGLPPRLGRADRESASGGYHRGWKPECASTFSRECGSTTSARRFRSPSSLRRAGVSGFVRSTARSSASREFQCPQRPRRPGSRRLAPSFIWAAPLALSHLSYMAIMADRRRHDGLDRHRYHRRGLVGARLLLGARFLRDGES